MRKPRTLGPWLKRFLIDHIVTERRLARNTQKSYRDSFVLLLKFLEVRAGKPADDLAFADLTAPRVLEFLDHLEQERGCSVRTCNQRLAAIRSFARFVGSQDRARLAWSVQIRAIATRKAPPRHTPMLSKAEVNALLAVPDRRTARGRVEHALLLFLCDSGARASEVSGLLVGDLEMDRGEGRDAMVTLRGKGCQTRLCPLWPRTEQALAGLVRGRADSDAVFLSRHRKPYTRHGVYRLVQVCAGRVPELAAKKVTPHVLRHTRACHLLQAGVDFNTIRSRLGPVSIDTASYFEEVDPDAAARAAMEGWNPFRSDSGGP